MAVASSALVNITANRTTNSLVTVSCGGANPTIIIAVGIPSSTVTVTSLTWSLGGGTPFQITSTRSTSAGGISAFLWAVPTPTTGNGQIRAGYSARVSTAGLVVCYTGVSSTPSASSDRVTSVSISTHLTLTPANLASSDATELFVNNLAGNPTCTTPFNISTSTANAQSWDVGWNQGTTGVTEWNDGGFSSNQLCMVAVRIQAVGAAPAGTKKVIFPQMYNGNTGGVFTNNRLMKISFYSA